MVPVTEHHPARTLAVHLLPFGQGRHEFGSVGLVPAFVEDIQAVLVRKFEIAVHGRIVRSAYSVEIELLEYLHILADGGFVHRVSGLRMLHVGVDRADLDGLAVQQEYAVPDLGLLESEPGVHAVEDLARSVLQFEREVVKVGGLGRPFERFFHRDLKPYSLFGALTQRERTGRHPCDGPSVPGDLGAHAKSLLLRVVGPDIHLDRQVGIGISPVEIRDHIPVEQALLPRRVEPDVVEYARQAPIVLPFEIISVGVLGHQHGNGVLPGLDILGDIVLRGLLGPFVVSYLLAVDPHERRRGDLFETEEYLPALPGRRHGELTAIGAGWVQVVRDVRRIGLERGRDIPEKGLAESLHLPVRRD